MLRRLARPFLIKTKIEAYFIIFALGVSAFERGKIYLDIMPGVSGKILFVAPCLAVVMAGARILDYLRLVQSPSKTLRYKAIRKRLRNYMK